MMSEDLIDDLSNSNDSEFEKEIGELSKSECEPCDADTQKRNIEVKEDVLDGEAELRIADIGFVNEETEVLPSTEMEVGLTQSSPVLEVTVEMKEVSSVAEDVGCLDSERRSENGNVEVQEGSPTGRQKRDGSPVSNSLSGVKKARIMVDEQQPSVHLMYNFLPRDSKQKLEELLQRWSEWHAQRYSSSHDSGGLIESGELTYFPALCIGSNDSSSVSVWMDNRTRNHQSEGITELDGKAVPFYDRGYTWALTSTDFSSNTEGGLEMVDSRCFNCGAYSHALKECPKPRDNVAISNARKQHSSKRNLNPNSRNPTRYYQNSAGGKYDGLRPGTLDAETRQLLGLGELDPPPWLNRMREIGYPPGYLDPDDENQPSGIMIFGDEKPKEETEDGEISETDCPEPPVNLTDEILYKVYPEPPRKKSVQFPGINAPIPENADESRWSAGTSSSDFYRNRWHQRPNRSSEKTTYHDQRWSRDIRDEDPLRYDDYDSYSYPRERGSFGTSISSNLERSSDRSRWSSSHGDDSPNHRLHHSGQSSPPDRLLSSRSYGSGSRRWSEDSGNDYDPNHSSRYRDRDDKQHSRRR